MGNLADMQSALVDYIEMVGMSGYAQAEAAGTIQGSLASAKSAWENLLTGVADGTKDMDSLSASFVNAVDTVLGNILPKVETSLDGVSTLIDKLAPVIIDRFPSLFNRVSKGLVKNSTKIVKSFSEVLPEMVETFVGLIADEGPELIEAGIDLTKSLVTGFANAFTNPRTRDDLKKSVKEIATILSNNAKEIIPASAKFVSQIATSMVSKIGENAPQILEFVKGFASEIVTPENTSNFVETSRKIVEVLGNGIVNAIPMLADTALSIIDSLGEEIGEALPLLVSSAGNIITALIDYILKPNNLENIDVCATNLIVNLSTGIFESLFEIQNASNKICETIWETITGVEWGALGEYIVKSIGYGLSQMWSNFVDDFEDRLNSIINPILSFLGDDTIVDTGGFFDFEGAKIPKLEKPTFNKYYGNGGEKVGNSQITINQNIYSEAKTAADLMREAIYQQELGIMMGVR